MMTTEASRLLSSTALTIDCGMDATCQWSLLRNCAGAMDSRWVRGWDSHAEKHPEESLKTGFSSMSRAAPSMGAPRVSTTHPRMTKRPRETGAGVVVRAGVRLRMVLASAV